MENLGVGMAIALYSCAIGLAIFKEELHSFINRFKKRKGRKEKSNGVGIKRIDP